MQPPFAVRLSSAGACPVTRSVQSRLERVQLDTLGLEMGERIPEIRFTITEKLDRLILKSSDELGVSKAEYIKSIVLRDLRNAIISTDHGSAQKQHFREGKG